MADTTITIDPAPWRDQDVAIYERGTGPVVPDAEHIAPAGIGSPIREIPVSDDGSFDVEVPAVNATLLNGVEGDDNAIRWTAQDAGADGNGITIALIDPEGNEESLAVVVTDEAIEVSLETDAGGEIISTAAEVIAAIEGEEDADTLVAVDNEGDSDGTGVVVPVAETALAYGGETLDPGRYLAIGTVGSTRSVRPFRVQ